MREPALLEWATWATLDHYKNTELILLKGHLLLEVAIAHALVATGSISPKGAKAMSFRQKLDELKGRKRSISRVAIAIEHAQALNAMRNKLAHEPFHDADDDELIAWATAVLRDIPSHKYQRYTRRTRVTQAIAAVARRFYEDSI